MELWKLLMYTFTILSSIPSLASSTHLKSGRDKKGVEVPVVTISSKRDKPKKVRNSTTDPEEGDNVKFYIFTGFKLEKKRLRIGDKGLLQETKNFVFGKPFVIMIHGFLGACDGVNFPGLLVQAYFAQGRTVNLLCTDWHQWAYHNTTLSLATSVTAYRQAIENGLLVGKRLAEFIRFLKDSGALQSPRDVHVIGFSMGAHVAAAAATILQEWNFPGKIGRITGLDPAGPIYNFLAAEKYLDPTDALFVDVYHTNAGKLGMKSRSGHTDFYINGGVSQPECKNTGISKIDRIEPLTGICSHQMAPQYFAESISNTTTTLKACTVAEWKSNQETSSCTELIQFGEHSEVGSFGEYYVTIETNRSEQIWLPDVDF